MNQGWKELFVYSFIIDYYKSHGYDGPLFGCIFPAASLLSVTLRETSIAPEI